MRTSRVREVFLLTLASLLSLPACGDERGSAGPPGVVDDPTTGGDSEEITGEPGTCRKLCCSDAECAGGTCDALDDAQGTLGVCAATGAAGAGTFSESCWNDPELECNPLTSSGCETGDACDAIDDDPEFPIVVGCAGGETTGAEGESCDAAWGPWCAPGLHCVRN